MTIFAILKIRFQFLVELVAETKNMYSEKTLIIHFPIKVLTLAALVRAKMLPVLTPILALLFSQAMSQTMQMIDG